MNNLRLNLNKARYNYNRAVERYQAARPQERQAIQRKVAAQTGVLIRACNAAEAWLARRQRARSVTVRMVGEATYWRRGETVCRVNESLRRW